MKCSPSFIEKGNRGMGNLSKLLKITWRMVPHSSTLVWKIPWTEEPGGLQSMGLQRVGHD